MPSGLYKTEDGLVQVNFGAHSARIPRTQVHFEIVVSASPGSEFWGT